MRKKDDESRLTRTASTTAFKNPPFRISEEGWGEFDMTIGLTAADNKEHVLTHDLNFAQARYESKHVIVSTGPFCSPHDRLPEWRLYS
jgi:transcription initiation factor IIF auxiliary subunit